MHRKFTASDSLRFIQPIDSSKLFVNDNPNVDVLVVTDASISGDEIRAFISTKQIPLIGFLLDEVNNSTVLSVVKSYDAATYKALLDTKNGQFRPTDTYIDTAFGAFEIANSRLSGNVKNSYYVEGSSFFADSRQWMPC